MNVIGIEGVSIVSDSGKPLLSRITWHVKKGENAVILGLNGSGKTMLLNLIMGYVHPSSGRLSVLGRDFGRYDWRQLRKRIGLASASLAERLYVHETVQEIVLSGLYATIGLYDDPGGPEMAKAEAALELMGISGFSGRAYSELSQGERQKALIARAMVNAPELLLLDEPCSGLDLFAREKVLSSIQRLASSPEGPAIVMVSHHVEEIVPAFTHALLLREGEAHSSGRTEEVLTGKNLSSFFRTPVRLRKKEGRFHIELAR